MATENPKEVNDIPRRWKRDRRGRALAGGQRPSAKRRSRPKGTTAYERSEVPLYRYGAEEYFAAVNKYHNQREAVED